MKTINCLMNKLARAAAVAVAALVSGGFSAHAADIRFETCVPGYSTAGWILVVPELRAQLGGRVTYHPGYRRWVTDRVSRGETMRISVLPATSRERCQNLAIEGVGTDDGFIELQVVRLPYVDPRFRVSTDPSFDNVHMIAITTSGLFDQRIPIGSRP